MAVVGVAELGLEPDGRVRAGAEVLGPGDRVLVRTNPARDTGGAQHLALELLAIAQGQGVVVMNDPSTLARATTKLYLCGLPEHLRPYTLVSQDRRRLKDFVESRPRSVLKPLSGTRGQDVFLLQPGAANLNQILDVLCRQGLAMAQDFVPEAVEGDIRIVVLGGRVLEIGGAACAVRRVPPPHDFRSNVAVGGEPQPARLSEELMAVAEEAAQQLLEDGIHLAGLDAIGLKLVEVNVFATGGLPDAGRFAGEDFFEPVLDYFSALQP